MNGKRPPRKHLGRGPAIPYEEQLDKSINRMCGAAALSMVFKSFGINLDQAQIWQEVSTPDSMGTRYAMTYLMGAFALKHGLRAVIAKISEPLPALARCWGRQVRVIINRRLAADSLLGHFTVLAGMTSDAVIEHDPQNGPSLAMPNANLLELWSQNAPCPPCEITGNIMIAFDQPGAASPAEVCDAHHEQPATLPCPNPNCSGKSLPFGIVPAVGCAFRDCSQRTWAKVVCPWCDAGVLPR
jgi:hypothetical protein